MAEALLVEQVGKTFRNGTVALEAVTLGVEPGGFLVLLGPSGSGKTTLLRSIAGIERISTGRIALGDRVVAEGALHVPPERRGLSMVFQDYALWPHLSALENVAFALKQSALPAARRKEKAKEMLERVGLAHLCERYPAELSGGEQQRVAVARALARGAGLILCDEPLSNLDADLRERTRVQISELVRESGSTAVYITHDQSEAFALADRVGVLERGKLVQLGPPEEVYSRPSTAFVARFTGVAAELAVHVRQRAKTGALLEVELDGLPSSRPIEAEAGSGLLPGRGLLLVRPTAVRVSTHDRADCHVVGTVSDVAFRGRGYELAVVLANGRRVSGVLTAERVERNTPVGLELGPGGCIVFPGQAASACSDGREKWPADALPWTSRPGEGEEGATSLEASIAAASALNGRG